MSNPGEARSRLADIIANPERTAEIAPAAIPALLGELEVLRVRLWGHLLAHRQVSHEGHGREPERHNDRLLTPPEAAVMLGVTIPWLHRHHRHLPFARKLSRKTLRFSELGLRRWLVQQKRP